MRPEDITGYLQLACDRFLDREKYLLKVDANERSITHKFAEHLQKVFGEKWSVDCEYNRFGGEPKVIDELISIVGENVSTDSTKAKTVYPDIIVHQRGPDGKNLLVVEGKKDPSPKEREDDLRKLQAIKNQYSYEFAVFLVFYTVSKEIKFEFI